MAPIRARGACLAQLVNVMTPVLTDESRRGMTVTAAGASHRRLDQSPSHWEESRPGGRDLTKPVLIVRRDERYALA